ncbi:MAG: class I SAM-dependent methyltransferase [Vicinamibacterales bacterium]
MHADALRVFAGAIVIALGSAVGAQHQAPGHAGAGQHKPDHMQHRFSDAEKYAREFDDPSRDAWQMPARVIEALALRPGQSVADIGAGTGYFSTRLARSAAAPAVFAVDIEPNMIAHLKMRAAKEGLRNITPVQATADGPNLPAPVDTILVVDTFHHIPNRVEYFRRLRASLKPGGQLAIVDFRKDAPSGPPVEFRFTAEEISAELADAGYALAASHEFLPRQLFLVYRAK